MASILPESPVTSMIRLFFPISTMRARNISHNLHDFSAHAGIGPDLDENQLAFHCPLMSDIHDFDHIDQFVKLLGDLFDDLIIALNHDSHA